MANVHSQAPADGKAADTKESQQVRYRSAYLSGSIVQEERSRGDTSLKVTCDLIRHVATQVPAVKTAADVKEDIHSLEASVEPFIQKLMDLDEQTSVQVLYSLLVSNVFSKTAALSPCQTNGVSITAIALLMTRLANSLASYLLMHSDCCPISIEEGFDEHSTHHGIQYVLHCHAARAREG